MMKKCEAKREDPFLALLNMRNTPQEGMDTSPAQRLFGRRTRTLLPTAPALLSPSIQSAPDTQLKLQRRKDKMVKYDKGIILPSLKENDAVRMQPLKNPKDPWKPAKVVEQISPRSYIVQTPDKQLYRRDRQFIRKQAATESSPQKRPNSDLDRTSLPVPLVPAHVPDKPLSVPQSPVKPIDPSPMKTRSGRVIKPPRKLDI